MRIHYLSGSRADFGLMLPCLRALDASGDFSVEVVVTAQHLAPGYGDTVREVEASGLAIAARIAVALSGGDGSEMALAMAQELDGLTRLWSRERPDAVMLLGDRGEMLAGALAAVHLGIPVIHVGGGERSGTLDESFRHAVTKLAHVHLCTSPLAAERIVRMGEDPTKIRVIGAPGLVGIAERAARPIDLCAEFGLPAGRPSAVVVYHPVVQEAWAAAEQARAVIDAVAQAGFAQVILRPNSDAGGARIDRLLDERAGDPAIAVVDHLERDTYLRAVRAADLLIGNSSSGIIESASLGTRCVNVGSRQNARERNANTIDCPAAAPAAVTEAIARAARLSPPFDNVYGRGDADVLMVAALREIRFTPELLAKSNAY